MRKLGKFAQTMLILWFALYPLVGATGYATADGRDEDLARFPHKPLHGGYFGDAGDLYHYELVLESNGMVKLYLYDEEVKPLKVTGIPARWTLNPDAGKEPKGKFQESEDGAYFWAKLPDLKEPNIHILIEAEKKGQWVPMEFYLPVK